MKKTLPLFEEMDSDLHKRASEIVDKLDRAYPEAHQELKFSDAFELLIATILAAQCTDAKVNQVTATLFKKYPTPQSFVEADQQDVYEAIRGVTFAGSKAGYIKKCCDMLVNNFGGEVPNTVDDMVKLTGVGRKTANIVLSNAMGIPAIGVDTHTIRVPNRLGILDAKAPDKIEAILCELLPKERWHRANIVIQWHGRYTCTAKNPKCSQCVVFDLCDWEDKNRYA